MKTFNEEGQEVPRCLWSEDGGGPQVTVYRESLGFPVCQQKEEMAKQIFTINKVAGRPPSIKKG